MKMLTAFILRDAPFAKPQLPSEKKKKLNNNKIIKCVSKLFQHLLIPNMENSEWNQIAYQNLKFAKYFVIFFNGTHRPHSNLSCSNNKNK